MHPIPAGYYRVADGDTILMGDLMLGKTQSMCGQESYGWKPVPVLLVGQDFFEGALDLGHPSLLVRKINSENN